MTKKLRGNRPARTPAPGERLPVSFRVSPELKAKMDAASEQAGVSLMADCERRLRESFDFEADFGGARPAAFFRSLGAMIVANYGNADWLGDREKFAEVREFLIRMLRATNVTGISAADWAAFTAAPPRRGRSITVRTFNDGRPLQIIDYDEGEDDPVPAGPDTTPEK